MSADLALIAMDSGPRELMAQTATMRSVGAIQWGDMPYALHTAYDDSPNDSMVDAANQLLGSALYALRVHQAGRLYFGGIVQLSASKPARRFFQRPWPANSFAVYSITTKEEFGELRDFWTTFRSAIATNARLTLACRWFAKAAEAGGVEDRIILLMTAAEALFSLAKTTRGKGSGIVERAKATDPALGDKDATALENAYRLRNAAYTTAALKSGA